MKYGNSNIVFLLFFLICFFFYGQESLVDIYKSRKISFVPILEINEDKLPKDVYFQGIYNFSLDSQGNIYACDSRAHNIKKFNQEGNFLKVIGQEGQGPGDFNSPMSLITLSNRLVVWELRNRRLSQISTEGDFIRSSVSAQISRIVWSLAALPEDNFLLEAEEIDYRNRSKPQRFKLELYDEKLNLTKTLYTQDVIRNTYPNERGFGNVPQPFPFRVHWAVSSTGNIIIGYSKSYKIEVIDPIKGKLFDFNHDFISVKITAADKESFYNGISYSNSDGTRGRGMREKTKKYVTWPKFKPAFSGIMVDGQDNIWVFPFQKDPANNRTVFDVFNSKGEFVSQVRIEGDIKLGFNPIFVNNFVWQIQRDEEGDFRIVKNKITKRK